MTKKEQGWDTESNEVQSNWVKFNVPMEDKIKGTLIAKRTMKSTMQGREGEIVNVYDLKADEGSFHALNDVKKVIETPIVIETGSFWSVGGKAGLDAQMRNIKVGQKVGFKFIDERPAKTKGFAPAKNIRVYAIKGEDGQPELDTEWLATQSIETYEQA